MSVASTTGPASGPLDNTRHDATEPQVAAATVDSNHLKSSLSGAAAAEPPLAELSDLDERPAGPPPSAAKSLWRQWSGPLTEALVKWPAQFGLGMLPQRLLPDQLTPVVCGYCSTGCGLDIHLQGDRPVNLTPTPDHPVNRGAACPKGWEALSVLEASDRATVPLVRGARGARSPIDWPAALILMRDRLRQIQARFGPESVAFLSTGQIVTEEMALLGALAKFGMGMLHGDGNTRQCMATSVVAYKQSFGFDAPPYTYQDFEESDVIVLVGSNLCIAHPILWQRILRNRHRPQIIVIDPRRTETAMAATQHLPLAPKSDQDLLYGVARELLARGAVAREFIARHTTGFAEFEQFLAPFTLEHAAQATGLSIEPIRQLADTIQRGQRVSFWWTMGVNQSHQGVRTAQAIINLALMTGNIGRPGTGANSITGQCNAMGSRLFSNTTNLLGGRDFADPVHRAEVAKILGIPARQIPDRPSLAYHEILESILSGKIRGLWVVATNPAHSWINQGLFDDVLGRLDFLVVQDMYHSTETAVRADLLLPAAGWGEKTGTLINSERRIGVVKQVAAAPGLALSDFRIFRLVAESFGCGAMFRQWTSPEQVFELLKRLSRGRPCDFSGISDYAALERAGGIQWPYPRSTATDNHDRSSHSPGDFALNAAQAAGQRRLFEDGRFYHADGRARFMFDLPRPLPEPATPRYPYLLLTGRGSAAQWHTQTRTGKSAVLRKLAPQEPLVELHPLDARREQILPHERVVVESQRGAMAAIACISPAVQQGQVFIPMHYDRVNRLTDAQFDPHSKQPAYKACAVRLRHLQPGDEWR